MPVCILRVQGANFDVDTFLSTSKLDIDGVYRRGEQRSRSVVNEKSGFTMLVGDTDDIREQVSLAAAFLEHFRTEINQLRDIPGVEEITLDFGWLFPVNRLAARFVLFPLEMIRLCAELQVQIAVSVYAVDETVGQEN